VQDRLRAGQPAPRAGHYEVITRNGERTGIYRRGLKGRPLPPTPDKGQRYVYAGQRRRRNGG
jgi:hypothetical protein